MMNKQFVHFSVLCLARALLLLAHFGKKNKPNRALPHVDQAMLADMIGTTRPRVNFFMNKFRKLGLIDYDGTLNGPQRSPECRSA
jgi:CRP/FNR family transcriptional regulator, cyclic AMP receptor protein